MYCGSKIIQEDAVGRLENKVDSMELLPILGEMWSSFSKRPKTSLSSSGFLNEKMKYDINSSSTQSAKHAASNIGMALAV